MINKENWPLRVWKFRNLYIIWFSVRALFYHGQQTCKYRQVVSDSNAYQAMNGLYLHQRSNSVKIDSSLCILIICIKPDFFLPQFQACNVTANRLKYLIALNFRHTVLCRLCLSNSWVDHNFSQCPPHCVLEC